MIIKRTIILLIEGTDLILFYYCNFLKHAPSLLNQRRTEVIFISKKGYLWWLKL